MPVQTKIRVMISSRNKDKILFQRSHVELSEVRRKLRAELEATELFGFPLFEVWLNEEAAAGEGSTDSWDICMENVRRADIVLVLYNGNSGWAREGNDVGICHAELETALSAGAARVRAIKLPLQGGDLSDRDQRFRDYFDVQSLFRVSAENGEEVISRSKEALRDAVPAMVQLGVREARKGKFHTGQALDWSRLSGSERRNAMVGVLQQTLRGRAGAAEAGGRIFVPVDGASILIRCHGVPASLTNVAARELVGQPFLQDYREADALALDRAGPVQMLACHRAATETQAVRMLGVADVMTVTAPFGVLAADPISNVQLVLISNCRDETTTRYGVQRFFEWLQQSAEDTLVRERAQRRARISRAMAEIGGA